MLTVRIFSFSYRYSGIPEDKTANGGGFVFDCRCIPNPGMKVEFLNLTGKDDSVMKMLDTFEPAQDFFRDAASIVDRSVDKYISRNFTDLMVSFGCTGGQHRSVYFAEKMNKHLTEKYPGIETGISHMMFPDI